MPKNKIVFVEVQLTFPRTSDVIEATIKLDPASTALSGKPSVGEVTAAIRDAVLDAIKVKVTNGREVLAALKEARAAEAPDSDDDTSNDASDDE
jgi:hypothetical protein